MTGAAFRALPVLFAVAVAAVACGGDKGATPTAQTSMKDSAEQVIFGLQHALHEDGTKKAQLSADSALVFDGQTKFELRGSVKLLILDSLGVARATMTSAAATYSTARRSMVANGNVVVTTTDGKRLDTQHVVYDQITNKIRSDSAFVIVEPTRKITGASFTSDTKLDNLDCQGCVITQLTPLPVDTGRGG